MFIQRIDLTIVRGKLLRSIAKPFQLRIFGKDNFIPKDKRSYLLVCNFLMNRTTESEPDIQEFEPVISIFHSAAT